MNKIKEHLVPEIRNWISEADPEEIARVIEIGYFGQLSMKRKQQNDDNAARKGRLGENHVHDMLKPHFKIKDTSKKGKSGDFQIKTEYGLILVEVKNYSKTVGKVELDKFYRDIGYNGTIQAGIFISLYAPIVGIRERIHFEIELIQGRSVPIVYMYCDSADVIKLLVDLLTAHLRSRKSRDIDPTHVISKIDQMSESLGLLVQTRSQIEILRLNMNKSIDDIHSLVVNAELKFTKTIDEIQQNVKWKRLIPQNKFGDLWKFMLETFNFKSDQRQRESKLAKQITKDIYQTFHKKEWYYTVDALIVNKWRIFPRQNTFEIKFPIPQTQPRKIKIPTEAEYNKKHIIVPVNSNTIQFIVRYLQ